jgi:hypothetical protein
MREGEESRDSDDAEEVTELAEEEDLDGCGGGRL